MAEEIPSIVIRALSPSDKEAVRKISWDTAFLEHAKDLWEDQEILTDVLTLYFTDHEPESCFVADYQGRVIGYLLGAKDERGVNRIFFFRIFPSLFWKAVTKGFFVQRKIRRFLLHGLKSFLKGEFFLPDFVKRYPAVLHINVDKEFRSQDVGGKLIRRYFAYLREQKAVGVHVSTMSEKARKFFEKNGFKLLFTTRRTYLKYYFQDDTPLYILGQDLSGNI